MLNLFNKYKGNSKGFTLIESLTALLILCLIFLMLLGVFNVGVGKSNYVHNDSDLISFEQDIASWIKKDYRENSIKDISVINEDGSPKLVINLNDGSQIEYKNKEHGFYRVKPGESKKIGSNKVHSISLKNNKDVIITYILGNGEKSVAVKLDK